MLSKCQTALIQLWRLVTWRCIWIQAVCIWRFSWDWLSMGKPIVVWDTKWCTWKSGLYHFGNCKNFGQHLWKHYSAGGKQFRASIRFHIMWDLILAPACLPPALHIWKILPKWNFFMLVQTDLSWWPFCIPGCNGLRVEMLLYWSLAEVNPLKKVYVQEY